MKHLFVIGGPMGVGKTATSKKLNELLPNSVFLDGDWCWDMSPFQVNEDTKAMVLRNIAYLLNSFLACPAIDNIVFCWVMHEQTIIDEIVRAIQPFDGQIHCFSLICSEEALADHFRKDIESGLRTKQGLEQALSYLKRYTVLETVKLDITKKTPEEAALEIANTVQ